MRRSQRWARRWPVILSKKGRNLYNKLFAKILDSSIWLEGPHVRLVWVTFLASMDQDGVVQLSAVGNVANRARVTEEEAADAIRVLEGPDKQNPQQANQGRRIERIPEVGWLVLNAKKYRDIVKAEAQRAAVRERVARHRAAMKASNAAGNAPVTQSEAVSDAVAVAGKGLNASKRGPKGVKGVLKDVLEDPPQ